jgi:putative redox protein
MIIELQQQEGSYHFIASNESSNSVHIDAAPAIGGQGKGARPMELLIMGVGGCSGIDVINILSKQRIAVQDLKIKIDAEREKDAVPSLFTKIHITFIFKGEIDKVKAEKAVGLSLEKYCSAAKTLEKTAVITSNLIFE